MEVSDKDIQETDQERLLKKRTLLFQQLKAKKTRTQPVVQEIPRQKRDTNVFPLSFGQERLWFLEQLQPGTATYHIPVTLRLLGALCVKTLIQSFQSLIALHEILRTNFTTQDGHPVQIIHPNRRLDLPVIDLTRMDASIRDSVIQQQAQELALKLFDFQHDPLLRLVLLRITESEHILLLNMHHMIVDGWSIRLMVRDLAAFYAAHAQQQSPTVPPLPIQYADYAVWQRNWLQGDVLENHLAYWRKQLADITTLTLPTDYPRPAIRSLHGDDVVLHLNGELTEKINALSQQTGTTLFMLLSAAWQVLLGRYSGQTDVAIGSPIAGRLQSVTEQLIGFFVNTLVLRTDLSGDPYFLDVLTQVRTITLDAYAHQAVPFEVVVDAVQPERDLSRQPLFQATFVLQNISSARSELTDLQIQRVDIDTKTAKFDLTLYMNETSSGLSGVLEYATDLFDRSTIVQMLSHFQNILANVVDNPQQSIHAISLLTSEERYHILTEWNATAIPSYLTTKYIHSMIAEQTSARPDAIALVFDQINVTYHKLDQLTNQLAHILQRQGVGPDIPVGICLDRSVELVIAVLAVFKAGGAYVPLDPQYPAERLQFIIQDAGVEIFLTQQHLPVELPANQTSVITIDDIWATAVDTPTTLLPVVTHPDQLAYIIYTSGSTGRPKGVMVPHRGLINLAHVLLTEFDISHCSRVLQFASLNFDAAITEIMMALVGGATLYLAPATSLLDPHLLLETLRTHAITTVTLPPSLLAVLPAHDLPSLTVVASAGERCTPNIRIQWGVNRRFLNGYGPTETTVAASYHLGSDDESRASVPIGGPIANAQMYVLDTSLSPVPRGVAGEIYISGVGLSRGYLARPDLTADRFVPHPFSSQPGQRMYQTGDVGRHLADGTIEVLGRTDDQVKLRGFRIELGEIDASLQRHTAVRDAVSVVREDIPGHQQLVSYVVHQPAPALALWPSVAEFFVYDDLLYYAMTHDEQRNECYRAALRQTVQDKIVVDIGTGKDAILARMCIEEGAHKVYAIELLPETYHKAQTCLRELGLEDRIILLQGDATKLDLPELADVCVSEIVGAIGGSEGAAAIINEAHRHLKPHGRMIPERSITKVAAVTLPDEFINNPGFDATGAPYVGRIFDQVGYPFDLRLCLKGLSYDHLISTVAVFEDLDFRHPIDLELSHPVHLTITRNGRLDGLVVWLTLQTVVDIELDILAHEHCWLPVYLPIGYPGLIVKEGDTITGEIQRTLCDNRLNPDYRLILSLHQSNGGQHDFIYDCHHYRQSYTQHPFYEQLFAQESLPLIESESYTLNHDTLRQYVQQSLPPYMVPSAFVLLDTLPLTPNGKVDRKALPAPEYMGTTPDFVAPRDTYELQLARIWEDILGIAPIDVTANFFDLGGDSILSLQIIARAAQMDMHFSLNDLFQHPTVGELATIVRQEPLTQISQALVTGSVPLTPIQHWFFDQSWPNPHHFNQSVLLQTVRPLDLELLRQVIYHLLLHHDALRMRFAYRVEGWYQYCAAPDDPLPFSIIDLSHISADEQAYAIESAANEIQQSLHITTGPLCHIALITLGNDEPTRLLFCIHHLVIDGVSWRILLEDFQIAYQQLETGKNLQLPLKTTAFQDWGHQLTQYAQSETLQREIAYWQAQPWQDVQPMPVDMIEGENIIASACQYTISVSPEDTATILRDVLVTYDVQINEVLLTAFVQAWMAWSGQNTLLLDLEGHGREDLFDTVDLSRTVGWFTAIYPVILQIQADIDPIDALQMIQQQIRAIPQRGIGYGILRYLTNNGAIRDSLKTLPLSQVSFNYLGQFDQTFSDTAVFSPAPEASGMDQDARAPRQHLLGMSGSVVGGQLHLTWTYSDQIHMQSTIEHLAHYFTTALQHILDDCHKRKGDAVFVTDEAEHSTVQVGIEWLLGSTSSTVTHSFAWSPIVPIRKTGTQPPLFLVHPSGGNTFCYTKLAHYLDSDQPVYGIQAKGLIQGQDPYEAVEDMATYYVDELRRVQPKGPYNLGGWSGGAIVAFEMAQQLRAQGQIVKTLVLLDQGNNTSYQTFDHKDSVSLLYGLVDRLGLSSFAFPDDQSIDEIIATILQQAQQERKLPSGLNADTIQRFIRVYQTNHTAAGCYRVQPYAGRISLFLTEQSRITLSEEITHPEEAPLPDAGWESIAQDGVDIYLVPGAHMNMLEEPHVQQLATQLQMCLTRTFMSHNEELQ